MFGISNFFLFIYVYRKLVLFIVVIVLFCEVVRIYIMVGFYVIDIYSIVRIWLLYIFVYVWKSLECFLFLVLSYSYL